MDIQSNRPTALSINYISFSRWDFSKKRQKVCKSAQNAISQVYFAVQTLGKIVCTVQTFCAGKSARYKKKAVGLLLWPRDYFDVCIINDNTRTNKKG